MKEVVIKTSHNVSYNVHTETCNPVTDLLLTLCVNQAQSLKFGLNHLLYVLAAARCK